MSFVEALYQGDICYEDELFNVKRTIFVDRLGPGEYILSIHFGYIRYRSRINEHILFAEFRRLNVSLEKGWMVYNAKFVI